MHPILLRPPAIAPNYPEKPNKVSENIKGPTKASLPFSIFGVKKQKNGLACCFHFQTACEVSTFIFQYFMESNFITLIFY